MLNVAAIPSRRVSLRPEPDFGGNDRRRSSFNVADDYHNQPRRFGSARPSVVSNMGSRMVSARGSRISTDSFEMSDYRGSFSIYNHETDDGAVGEDAAGWVAAARGSLVFAPSDGSEVGLGGSTRVQLPHQESYAYQMLPILPVSASVACLVLNVLLPGSGTVASGLLNLCLSPWTVENGKEQCEQQQRPPLQPPGSVLCVNFWIGLGQLATVIFLLVGWFWSLAWGIYLVNRALSFRREMNSIPRSQISKQPINEMLNESSAGDVIRSGIMSVSSMIDSKKKHFGVDDDLSQDNSVPNGS